VHLAPATIESHNAEHGVRKARITRNEISFNSSLMPEMRAVSFVTSLITQRRRRRTAADADPRHRRRRVRGRLSATSKMNADRGFLIFLRGQGLGCAGDRLAKNYARLGVESSVDIDGVYP
jgi:NTE family protein